MPIQTAIDSISNSQGSPFGFKNRIINGAVGISQRATTGTAVAVSNSPGGTFGPDRFYGYSGTLSLWNIYQVSTGALDFPYAFRTQRIAGQTSTSASYFGQTIETNNCIHLAGQTVTISFYATAGANYSGGAATIQLLTGTAADQGTSSLNQALWTGLAVPINQTFIPTITRTRFSFTATIGASVQEIAFRFNWSGSGTAGANDYLDITGIQLEKGTQATAFDYRDFGRELFLCQRYFQTSFPTGTAPFSPATSQASNVGLYTWKSTMLSSGYGTFNQIPLITPMRTSPTITGYNGGNNNNLVRNVPGAGDITTLSTSAVTNTGFIMQCYGGAQDGTGNPIGWNWTATAEL
jgi:hypothetical protein